MTWKLPKIALRPLGQVPTLLRVNLGQAILKVHLKRLR